MALVVVSGCADVHVRERALNVEDGAIMKEGILKGGLHPKLEVQAGAFPEPILKVEKGAVEVHPGAFQGPAIKVEPEAVKFSIETGAFTFHEGAININLGSKKIPKVDVEAVRAVLENLKTLDGLDAVDDGLKNKIVNNEEIYQAAIGALLAVIEQVNKKYGESQDNKTDK